MPDEAMPDEQGYNGWTNYETWCVNLWLTNDQETYSHASSLPSASAIKELVRDWKHETIPCAGIFADLLESALQSVNWYEIYDNLHKEDESD